MNKVTFNNNSNSANNFEDMTNLMLQVIIGNEQTEQMLAYIVKDAPDEQQAQGFCKFVAALTCMAPDMREGFAKTMNDENVEGAMKLADMICEELHIWQYSQLHTHINVRKGKK